MLEVLAFNQIMHNCVGFGGACTAATPSTADHIRVRRIVAATFHGLQAIGWDKQ
jgi:hypothetical protein